MANLFVLDDDSVFHRLIELSISRSRPFKSVYHYYDAKVLLDYILANKHDHSNLPDIIFVDIKMPLLDGWGFMDALQGIYHSLTKKIDIYIVTVSVMKEDKKRAFTYSFVKDFIVKPVAIPHLITIAQSAQTV